MCYLLNVPSLFIFRGLVVVSSLLCLFGVCCLLRCVRCVLFIACRLGCGVSLLLLVVFVCHVYVLCIV